MPIAAVASCQYELTRSANRFVVDSWPLGSEAGAVRAHGVGGFFFPFTLSSLEPECAFYAAGDEFALWFSRADALLSGVAEF
jgi:hypothetical protein